MADYERYHGIVLRALITELPGGVHVKAEDAHGVVNSFIINQNVGLYIKHSAKRLSPWLFGFNENHITELNLLFEHTEQSFVCLVCEYNGFLTLSLEEFQQLMDAKETGRSLSIQVKTRKRHMYAVGGRNKLERTKRRGFSEDLLQAITN